MPSKFDTACAEAAYFIAGHGFAESEEGSVDEDGWNALVEVTHTVLLNLDAPAELFAAAAAEWPDLLHGAQSVTVWVHENSAGFVGTLGRDTSGTSIREIWDMRF